MSVQQSDLIDPALATEVDLARAAAQEEAGDERVGEYVAYHVEDEAAVTHLFEADKPGYGGWRWAVTITSAGPDTDITVSEVVLLPGPSALVAPDWIPWQNRVQAGDLGVGDLLPTDPDDPRLVPAYLQSDDPAVEEVATEAGLGRVRVMSRPARVDAAERWHQSEFGPRSDMARSAPAHCGTCGFYLPLAGSLRAAFGTCGNELSPADAHVVHAEYGCGAHSEAEVEQVSPVLVADLIYDDAQLDVEPLTVVDEIPPPAEAIAPTTAPEVTEPEAVTQPETVAEPETAAASDLGTEPETSMAPEAVADAEMAPESAVAPEVPEAAQPETVAPEVVVEPEVAAASETTVAPQGFSEPEASAEASVSPAGPEASSLETAPVDDVESAATVTEGALAEPVPAIETPVSTEPVEDAESSEATTPVEPPSAEPVIISAEDAAPAEVEPVVLMVSAPGEAVEDLPSAASERMETPASTAVESAADEGWVPLGQVYRPVGESPLRARFDPPVGHGGQRLPSFSLRVPRGLIRRRNSSAGD